METPHSRLTPRQQRFVEEYTGGESRFLGRPCAILAGFSKASAHAIAGQLLAKPHVKAAIEARMKEMSERCAVNVETITKQLTDAYELAMCGVVERGEGKPQAIMANASPSAAVAAAMGLAKLHGLIVDKKAETTPDGKPLPPTAIKVVFVHPASVDQVEGESEQTDS